MLLCVFKELEIADINLEFNFINGFEKTKSQVFKK
jgi:hypothetical protein